jgi:hypothetical protein
LSDSQANVYCFVSEITWKLFGAALTANTPPPQTIISITTISSIIGSVFNQA